MADTFYDKVVTLYTSSEAVDNEGWAGVKTSTEDSSFYGNVRFDNLALLQENYGLKDVIDIAITTDEEVAVGKILGYEDKMYMVMKSISFDSHNLIIGKVWSSKSST